MRTRELVESHFQSHRTFDLGENYLVSGIKIPRFTTWKINRHGAPVDLISLEKEFCATDYRSPLQEVLTKSDKDDISKMIRKEIGGKGIKPNDKQHLAFVKNVLISLFRTLYTKRSFWTNDLTGSHSS